MKAARYAVIIAGGKGTRFWPLSRASRPKQILKIASRKSLIRETFDRIAPLTGRKNALVVTVKDHAGAVRKELAGLPTANFIVEPEGKNTAPCIGLAAVELARRDPGSIMCVLPADHWISNINSFRRTLEAGMQLAERSDVLVTIGVKPGYPETGYGYILKGKSLEQNLMVNAYKVKGFKEKPALRQAARLLRSGALWNSGIFIWNTTTILALLERFNPAIYQGLLKIQSRGGVKNPSLLRREYARMPNISIDHAVLEKAGSAGKVVTLEADFGWSDVGSWTSLHQLLPRDAQGNAGLGRRLLIDTKDSLVYSENRLVVLLGVKNTLVVDSPDAILVADLKRSQQIRDVVAELERKGHRRYLA
jgi:mannose-1-phosphate guanylyltransferase